MKTWMEKGENNEINVRHCPRCKQLVLKTQRYADFIKDAYQDIINVKRKLYGTPKDNEKIQLHLIVKVKAIKNSNADLLKGKLD